MREDEDGARSSRDKRIKIELQRFTLRSCLHRQEISQFFMFSSVDEIIVYKRKAGDRKRDARV